MLLIKQLNQNYSIFSPTIPYKDIDTIPCEQRKLAKEDLIDDRYLNIKSTLNGLLAS